MKYLLGGMSTLATLIFVLIVIMSISRMAQAAETQCELPRATIAEYTQTLQRANDYITALTTQNQQLKFAIEGIKAHVLEICQKGAYFEARAPDDRMIKFYCSKVTEL